MILVHPSRNSTLPLKSIEEPARKIPLYGEYEIAVLGGGPAGIRGCLAAARAGAAHDADRALWFSRRHGHGGRRHQFLRPARQCFGQMQRVVQGIAVRPVRADRPARRAQGAASIFGKIQAQAYDTAAYKIAADDLLAADKVDIFFHALGAGVVMQDDRRIDALLIETKAGRRAVAAVSSSMLGRRRSRGLGRRALRDRRRRTAGDVPLDDVPHQRCRPRPRRATPGRTIPALMQPPKRAGRRVSAQGRDRPAAEERRSNGARISRRSPSPTAARSTGSSRIN